MQEHEYLAQYALGARTFTNETFDEVTFNGHTIEGCTFTDCTFTSCSFVEASVIEPNIPPRFRDCIFTDCDFAYAILEALFSYCVLLSCNFYSADLGRSDLEGSTFNRCCFEKAELDGVNLHDVDGVIEIYVPDMSSRKDSLYVFNYNGEPMIKAGCWWGTLKMFRKRVIETYGEDNVLYLEAIKFIKKAVKTWE